MGQPEKGADEPGERTIRRYVIGDLDFLETLVELLQDVEGFTLGIPYSGSKIYL